MLTATEKLKMFSDKFYMNGYRKPFGNYELPPMVDCLGLHGPLRQYFSLYLTISQRGRRKTRKDRWENIQTAPVCTYSKQSKPNLYYGPNLWDVLVMKDTQYHLLLDTWRKQQVIGKNRCLLLD